MGWGLSPRVRGNHRRRRPVPGHRRSIPARAGEPSGSCKAASRQRVYPRACGGTHQHQRQRQGGQGLSPRVRGNHRLPESNHVVERSIPARAGEPRTGVDRLAVFRVYPRACGGTVRGTSMMCDVSGLSPRVRGNPNSVTVPIYSGVYPRACGGTARVFERVIAACGLSPRVRGNLGLVAGQYSQLRSIPARAGEPRTAVIPGVPRRRTGLSPRVRGNPFLLPAAHGKTRSIPARAGEPTKRVEYLGKYRVYPRACGGTHGQSGQQPPLGGLSPRVRGKPVHHPSALWPFTGLSPRVRGNPLRRHAHGRRRSIPARAGEPVLLLPGVGNPDQGLSPRVRGNLLVN